MLFRILSTFAGCLLAVQCRDINKAFKAIPTITSSLVNLGKMDISFYFNTKDVPLETIKNVNQSPYQSFFFSKPPTPSSIEEPCPCSSLRGIKENYGSQPSGILNKLLMNNGFFPFNKESRTSTLCCGSHEHEEDSVTFEFGSQDRLPTIPLARQPSLPFIFQNLLSRRPQISTIPTQSKTVDILFIPNNRDHSQFLPKKSVSVNKDIQIVGDKELKNEFKSLKFRPSLPIVNIQSSVKKDLTAQEKSEITGQPVKKDTEFSTPTALNAL